MNYVAGDPPIVIQEQLQVLEPPELAAQCPSMVQTHNFTVESGAIEADWINIDEIGRQITFWTPASFEGNNVESAVIRFTMAYAVISSTGQLYTSITKSFAVNVEESSSGFCLPEGFGLPPSVTNVDMYLGDDPSRLIIASKSRNINCTDTTFSVRFSNGTAIDAAMFQLEVVDIPHQSILNVYADRLGTFSV